MQVKLGHAIRQAVLTDGNKIGDQTAQTLLWSRLQRRVRVAIVKWAVLHAVTA